MAAPIPGYNGGTGSEFFEVDGLTAARTFTFPDSDATIPSSTEVDGKLSLTGGTMLGDLILHGSPTSSLMAATKDYVDMLAAGFNQFVVTAASTANLTGTYNNGSSGVGATFTLTATGAFSLDGLAGVLNAQYLLKDQASTFQNGIYRLTTVGNGGTQAVLTRATDYNTPADITAGDLVNVAFGSVNAGISYIELSTVTTIGTDPITFSRWGGQSISGTGDVSFSGFSPVTTTIGAGKVTNAMLAGSIDLTSKVTGILPNVNTTATNANTGSAIVARDPSGNFAAGTIAASLSGNATTATTATNANNVYVGGTFGPGTWYPLFVSSISSGYQVPAIFHLWTINPSGNWTFTTEASGSGFNFVNDGGSAYCRLSRNASTDSSKYYFSTNLTDEWSVGQPASGTALVFHDETNNVDILTLTKGSGTSSTGAFAGNISANNLSGTNTGNVTLAGQNYLSISGQVITANAVDLSGTNATGILAAARFPALTGDISTSSGSLTTAIGANKVTLAQMAQIVTASFLGRNTASTGNVEVLSEATVKTMLNLTGTNSGDVTLSGQNYLSISGQVITANAVDLSGTNATGILAAARFPALTGDITTSSGAIATTIAANAVTYAKFQQVAASSLVGNATGSLANATGVTLGSTLTFVSTALQTLAITGDVTASANSFVTTVAKINGATLGTTTASSGNILIGSGTQWVTNAVSGDITIGSTGVTAIGSNKVTYAKFQQVAAISLVGNATGSLANATGITLGTSLTFSGSTINTIQGIRTTDSPTFTGLTATGVIHSGSVTLDTTTLLTFPALASRKIKLYDDSFSDNFQYHGFGIDTSTVTYNVPDTAHWHSFRCGTSSSTFNDLLIIAATSSYPGADNSYTLGKSGNRWSQLWAGTTTINTSDASTKNSIAESRLGLDFINKLTAREFKFNSHTFGTGRGKGKVTPKRIHYGLIAQEVKQVLDDLKIDSNDFAGYIDPRIEDPKDESPCGLRYSEFIAPLILAVQQLSQKIDELTLTKTRR